MGAPAPVTLTAPKGVKSCSVAGVEYTVAKGRVDVPADAVAELVRHGFAVADLSAEG